ncbi:MAG: HepT-like ribonuclease domain-containing protein [Cyanobacteria bacterium P01_D01_bin.128]
MSRDREALVDILEAIKLILQYAEGQDLKMLATNIEKQDAILRRIIVIGEATKQLSQRRGWPCAAPGSYGRWIHAQ